MTWKTAAAGINRRERAALPDMSDGCPSERVWEILESCRATSPQSIYGEIVLRGQAGSWLAKAEFSPADTREFGDGRKNTLIKQVSRNAVSRRWDVTVQQHILVKRDR